MLNIVYFLFMLILPACYLKGNQTSEQVFTEIIKNNTWGINPNSEGVCGGGSTLQATEVYREFLQDFFLAYDIHSAVDVGCGDWEFSRAINWDGISYFGYDVVASIIAKNQTEYASSNIQFFQGDAINTDLPEADLLICKDVLQHLNNEDIIIFINQLKKFKYCLIVNDIDLRVPKNNNRDIFRGSTRPVDLTQPPFSLSGVKILTFPTEYSVKQVLLIDRTKIDHKGRTKDTKKNNFDKGQGEKKDLRQRIILETGVQDDKVMQDFDLESLPMGVDHSQTVKATPIGSDYNSKDCVNLSSSTAVSRIICPILFPS